MPNRDAIVSAAVVVASLFVAAVVVALSVGGIL